MRVLACIVALAAVGCVHRSAVRTFPEACPSGWSFLYTEHVHGGVVCERDGAK